MFGLLTAGGKNRCETGLLCESVQYCYWENMEIGKIHVKRTFKIHTKMWMGLRTIINSDSNFCFHVTAVFNGANVLKNQSV